MANDATAEGLGLVKRKLEVMTRILELKAENRKLDQEFVRLGNKDLSALAVMVCW